MPWQCRGNAAPAARAVPPASRAPATSIAPSCCQQCYQHDQCHAASRARCRCASALHLFALQVRFRGVTWRDRCVTGASQVRHRSVPCPSPVCPASVPWDKPLPTPFQAAFKAHEAVTHRALPECSTTVGEPLANRCQVGSAASGSKPGPVAGGLHRGLPPWLRPFCGGTPASPSLPAWFPVAMIRSRTR